MREPLLNEQKSLARNGRARWCAAAFCLGAVVVCLCAFTFGSGPARQPPFWSGVSLGGWLLMEINLKSQPSPQDGRMTEHFDTRISWMFDQIEASSELDFVLGLRADFGDVYALSVMRNHWSGYIDEAQLDKAAALDVNAVRIPVGYWIIEPPLNGSSPYQYGFQAEGFATGGLNHLHALLPKLRARGMSALIDVHALPCNSRCVSNGMTCHQPLAFGGGNVSQSIMRCRSGTYRTERPGGLTWTQVAVRSVASLAEWVATLPTDDQQVVVALQLANEPALNTPGYDVAVKDYYRAVLPAVRALLPALPLALSFIGPNDRDLVRFIPSLRDDALIIDFHWYLNWAAFDHLMGWAEIHSRACGAATAWTTYAPVGQKLIIGEWSLAVNQDAPLDLRDALMRRHLQQLYREQLHAFTTSPLLVGAFFWTLRMGSGWDPRPTAASPRGAQVEGSSPSRALPGYPYSVWSLLEMAEIGVAGPLTQSVEDVCNTTSPARA
mmetsp:Transcript_6402/g.14787  ORF Transcript_6402/g.14787 Transcript_6402/m.14787 type:complete len:495 (-) Transcript_6402:220-1704(-)